MPRIRLITSKQLSTKVSEFAFEAPFTHEAGQYVAVSAEVDGEPAKRYYSIASPPRQDSRFEICIRHDGDFGAVLRSLAPGAEIDCSDPAGNMRLLDPGHAAVYFAAGTGISPVRAILLAQLAANPAADATLVLGARHAADLLYAEELEALAMRHPGFRFVPTLSGEEPDWNGRRGRVTAHVGDAIAGRADLDAYFCGQPEMVASLRETLATRGIPDERQSFERY